MKLRKFFVPAMFALVFSCVACASVTYAATIYIPLVMHQGSNEANPSVAMPAATPTEAPATPEPSEAIETPEVPVETPEESATPTVPDASEESNPIASGTCPSDHFMDVSAHPDNASLPDPYLAVSCDESTVYISSNSIPNHATGAFPNPGNPNTISAQDDRFELPIAPQLTGSATYLDHATFGVAINGLEFDPMTAEAWNNDMNSGWNYDALGGIRLGLDSNNAHVQPTGAYHYHSIPTGLLDLLDNDGDMTLIGYAADGFPIYSLYGYRDATDSTSGVVEMQASWQVKSGTRPSGPGGAYDGTFNQDWEYVPALGDLDECNGRFGVTPEYPDGVYHYYLTDEYPYIPRCHMGTADSSFDLGRPGVGSASAPQSGSVVQAGDAQISSASNPLSAQPASGALVNGQAGGPPRPDFAAAAAALGIDEAELMQALGGPPPDFGAAAATLGVGIDDLLNALDIPAGGLGGPPPAGPARGPAGR